MALAHSYEVDDRPRYAESLLGLGGFAAQALTLAGQALVSGSELPRRAALERSEDVTMGHRRLTRLLAGEDDCRVLAVSSYVDEIGRVAGRVAAGAGAAEARAAVPRDFQLVDALHEMALEVSRMTQAAVESFVEGRPDAARELEVSAWRVRLGHRRLTKAAASFWNGHEREWAFQMEEIAHDLERAAGIALAINEQVSSARPAWARHRA